VSFRAQFDRFQFHCKIKRAGKAAGGGADF
jgi:hypothetical protein